MSSYTRSSVVVVLLGPPGAGKGTQCRKLAETLNIPHISTGDLLRECVRSRTALGLQTKTLMDAGLLVPDTLVMGMLEECTLSHDCRRGFILDGFPRTWEQAELLDHHLVSRGRRCKVCVLKLIVPAPVLLARMTARLICPACGSGYSTASKPPQKAGHCDVDGALLSVRQDDLVPTARERLNLYERQVPAIVRYYNRRGLVTEVDGDRGISEVSADLLRVIGPHFDAPVTDCRSVSGVSDI